MRFQLGHPAMSRMQEYLQSNFDGDDWGANGPMAVTNIMYELCGVKHAQDMTPEKCLGLTVLPYHAFYSIPFWEWNDIFDESKRTQVLKSLEGNYALHMWGRFSAKHLSAQSNSAFDSVARRNCPISYNLL